MVKKHPIKSQMTTQAVGVENVESALHDVNVLQAKNESAINLLKSWREGDEQEQRETWEYLKRALDADRLSNRRLFL